MWINRGLFLVSCLVFYFVVVVLVFSLTGPSVKLNCLARALSHSEVTLAFIIFHTPSFWIPCSCDLVTIWCRIRKNSRWTILNPRGSGSLMRVFADCSSSGFWGLLIIHSPLTVQCPFFFFLSFWGFLLIKMSYCTSSNAKPKLKDIASLLFLSNKHLLKEGTPQ